MENQPQFDRDIEELPLAGNIVIDISRVLAGPYCAQLLADMGARVIKIESPEGDENRRWPPFWDDDVSSNYGSVNRGKLGMALDLKSKHGQAILRDLIAKADVVLHNFLPGPAARLGLNYEQVRAINPRAVLCSLSGYGVKGALSEKPGYDLMMQAFSGAMSLTGYQDGPPVRIGVSYVDMASGMTAYAAVVTALLARARSGKGKWVHTSLLETAVSILGYHAVSWLQAGVLPRKEGCHAGNLSPYQPFACKDGGHIIVGATNNEMFRKLCDAVGCGFLADDPRFLSNALRVDHRQELNQYLEPVFATRTVGEWLETLESNKIPNSPVQTLDQVLSHPQVIANDMVVKAVNWAGKEVSLLGVPFKYPGYPGPSGRAAPLLGADSEEVLRDILRYDEQKIDRLMSVLRPGADARPQPETV
jgi:crotonobetainyl-CoA:carnitine CoA-transferase CaiB-like acyl-CoA transferase